MNRSDITYIYDILECVNLILLYLEHKTEYEFTKDIMLQDAINRRFEIIGEASSQISTTFKDENPSIPWRLMQDMRNKLIHDYFGISSITVYATSKQHLPVLKEQLEKLLM